MLIDYDNVDLLRRSHSKGYLLDVHRVAGRPCAKRQSLGHEARK